MNWTPSSNYKSIVVLTGAGISAESGIETFRASDGLWHNHKIEEVATPEGFESNPQLVHQFYNQRRKRLFDHEVQPNAGHIALAEIERTFGGSFLVVTQNVDNLHERAGSSCVIHMHGELLKAKCLKCQKSFDVQANLSVSSVCQVCSQEGGLRPDIVWFGEMPYRMDKIFKELEACDLFVSIGTSGNVYPAAAFVDYAHSFGAQTLELNLDLSQRSSQFDHSFQGPASLLVPLFRDLIQREM